MALLGRLLYRRGWLTAAGVGASVVGILVSLWWNAQLSVFINCINEHILISAESIAMAGATVLASAGIAYGFGMLSGLACETIAHDLRMGYARHFTALPLQDIEALGAGESLAKLQNEISEVSEFLRTQLSNLANDVIRFIGTVLWMLWLDPKLTLIIHLPVFLTMSYTVYSSRVIEHAAQHSQEANAQMGGFADTLIQLFPVLRIFDASELLQRKYAAALQQWEQYSITEQRTRAGLMSLSAVLSFLPLLCLFAMGGSQVIQGKMAMGTLYIFINLLGNVSGVLGNMPSRIAGFRRFCANMKRLEPLIQLREGQAAYGNTDG